MELMNPSVTWRRLAFDCHRVVGRCDWCSGGRLLAQGGVARALSDQGRLSLGLLVGLGGGVQRVASALSGQGCLARAAFGLRVGLRGCSRSGPVRYLGRNEEAARGPLVEDGPTSSCSIVTPCVVGEGPSLRGGGAAWTDEGGGARRETGDVNSEVVAAGAGGGNFLGGEEGEAGGAEGGGVGEEDARRAEAAEAAVVVADEMPDQARVTAGAAADSLAHAGAKHKLFHLLPRFPPFPLLG